MKMRHILSILTTLLATSLLAEVSFSPLNVGAMTTTVVNGVRDVKVNGTSVVSNNVANIDDMATESYVDSNFQLKIPDYTTTNAVNDLINTHVFTESDPKWTQNGTNVISNLITNNVASWAMHGMPEPKGVDTNAVKAIIEGQFTSGTGKVNRVVDSFDSVSNRVAAIEGKESTWDAKQDKIPDYTTTNAVKDIVGSASITNLGAKAYADTTFVTKAGTRIVMGTNAKIDSSINEGIAIGKGATVTSDVYDYATAIGSGAVAAGKHAFALGAGGVVASNEAAIAIGNSVTASGKYSTALGYSSRATANGSAAIGGNSYATSERATALGWAAIANATNSTAVGNGSRVHSGATGSTAIGSGAVVGSNAVNAVQIGYGTNNDSETIQFMGHKLAYDTDISSAMSAKANAWAYPESNTVMMTEACPSGSEYAGTHLLNYDSESNEYWVQLGTGTYYFYDIQSLQCTLRMVFYGSPSYFTLTRSQIGDPYTEETETVFLTVTEPHADIADKAMHDSLGNVITNTYALKTNVYTKTEVDNTFATPADISSAAITNAGAVAYAEATFLGKTAKASDADKLDGHDTAYFATASALSGCVKYSSNYSITLGTRLSGTTYGTYSIAQGYAVEASDQFGHAEGYMTKATGKYAHAEGSQSTTANGNYSHAEGQGSTTDGNYSHSEGENTTAGAKGSHAEGNGRTGTGAYGSYSHTEGVYTTTGDNLSSGNYGLGAHAEGYYSKAYGNYSHAEGYYSYAQHARSFVWQGVETTTQYSSSKAGTFSINPVDGTSGFYIGSQTLATIIDTEVGSASITNEGAKVYADDNFALKTNVYTKSTADSTFVSKNGDASINGSVTVAIGKSFIINGNLHDGATVYGTSSITLNSGTTGGSTTLNLPATNSDKTYTLATTADISSQAYTNKGAVAESSVNSATIASNAIYQNDSTAVQSYATNSIAGRLDALENGAPIVAKIYPLFIININPNDNLKWYDIELKGSTNNFENTSEPWNELVFWGATADNEDSSYVSHDWCRIFVSGKPESGDTRKWIRIRNTSELGDWRPKQVAILICPDDHNNGEFRRGQGKEWCTMANDDIIWTYLRFGSGTSNPNYEVDSQITGGESPKWREIMPVRWYSKIPEWAKQELTED